MITFETRKYYQVKDCKKRLNGIGLICPECFEHEQGRPQLVHDCKNIIHKDELKDGKLEVHSQCCCWSKAHGYRSVEQ